MRFALIAMVLALAGCSPPGAADIVTSEHMGNGRVVVFTDSETGCQYLKHNLGGALTPRLDRDGRQICVETPPHQ